MKFKSDKQRKAVMCKINGVGSRGSSNPFTQEQIKKGIALVKKQDKLNEERIRLETMKLQKPFNEDKFIQQDAKVEKLEKEYSESARKIFNS